MRFLSFIVSLALCCVISVSGLDFSALAADKSIHFYEGFDGSDPFIAGKWGKSTVEKYENQKVLLKTVTNPLPGFENDKGLELTQDGRQFYGIYSKFSEALHFSNEENGKDFVIQYELKLQESISCSGAYLKLPRVSPELDLTVMDNETPYTVMFGVDKCGSDTNKVHFILQFQNPLSGEWEEKHATDVPLPKLDKKTHLYTLLINRDNSYEIFIDKKSAKKGFLLTSMNPSIQPPAMIPDPSDSKPHDWVDDEKMTDPDDKKPEDWDEDQPRKIADPKAIKPVKWDENAPRQIPDPTAVKPDDWDDEEDGEWEAPLIDNPVCENPGCGPWSAPMIANPKFKGKWSARKIPNPAYKGVWYQKNMTNPAFYEVKDPFVVLPDIAGVAIEVHTNNAGIHFDNILVGRSLAAAFSVADATFTPKAIAEAVKDKEKKKKKAQKAIDEKKAKGDWREYLEALLMQAQEFAQDNMYAVIATGVALLVTLVVLILWPDSTPDVPNRTAAPASEPTSESEPAPVKSPRRGKRESKAVEQEDAGEEEVAAPTPTRARRSARN